MNTDLAAALLNQAANGAEMLQILETLSDDAANDAADDADPEVNSWDAWDHDLNLANHLEDQF